MNKLCNVCMEERNDYLFVNCKSCNNNICDNCFNRIKNQNEHTIYDWYGEKINDKSILKVSCPFCINNIKLYIYLDNNEFEILGYDNNNNLYKLYQRTLSTPIQYWDDDKSCKTYIFWGDLPRNLKYPSIFTDDINKNHNNIRNTFTSDDNTERMTFDL